MDLHVKLTAKDIFCFSMYHFYRTVTGIISMFCTVAVLGVVAASWSSQPGPFRVILFAGAVLVACCQPFIIYRKAVKQASDPVLSKEIFYKFDYSGFKVQQGKDKAMIRWTQIQTAKRIPGMYVLYLEKARAYLVPDWALTGDKKDRLLELIRAHVDERKRRGI